MNPNIPGSPIEILLFILFSSMAVIGALRVVTARDPFTSALSLLVNFVALGALYLMLEQPFVAIAQILVYAGAVVVLFLFVIAYLGDRRELVGGTARLPGAPLVAVIALLALAGTLLAVVIKAKIPKPAILEDTLGGHAFGSAQAVGEVFLTDYVLEFEATSLVLLVAVIGGIVLGLTGRARLDRMRKLMRTRSADEQRKLHESAAEAIRAERPDTEGGAS